MSTLRNWGRAGGWTAIAALVALVGVLMTWTHYDDIAEAELLKRVSALERSSIWQETVLYLLAQHEGITVPPRPAHVFRPDEPPLRDLLAAESNQKGVCP